MPRKSSSDPAEQRIIDDVEKYGWHCAHIRGDDKNPQHTYTVGLFSRYGHPEILIAGMESKTAYSIMKMIHERIKAGNPIDLSRPTAELLSEGHECTFVEVPKESYEAYVGWLQWYYEGPEYPVMQCVWQSKARVYPWSGEAGQTYKDMQPVLGRLKVLN